MFEGARPTAVFSGGGGVIYIVLLWLACIQQMWSFCSWYKSRGSRWAESFWAGGCPFDRPVFAIARTINFAATTAAAAALLVDLVTFYCLCFFFFFSVRVKNEKQTPMSVRFCCALQYEASFFWCVCKSVFDGGFIFLILRAVSGGFPVLVGHMCAGRSSKHKPKVCLVEETGRYGGGGRRAFRTVFRYLRVSLPRVHKI